MTQHIQLTRDKAALVSDRDCERVSGLHWNYLSSKGKEYAYAQVDGKRIYLHRFIMDAPAGVEVDHQDGNGLNCQRYNLRLCTHAQNQCNQKRYSTNKSGYKGVSWYKRYSKWRVLIKVSGKGIFLGYFDDPVEAARTYDAAARLYHGEFARTNF